MKPLAELTALAGRHKFEIYGAGDYRGGFIKGHLDDDDARAVMAAAFNASDDTGDETQGDADRWDDATVTRGHYRVVPCLNGCGDHEDPRGGWHLHPAQPGRGAFAGTEVIEK